MTGTANLQYEVPQVAQAASVGSTWQVREETDRNQKVKQEIRQGAQDMKQKPTSSAAEQRKRTRVAPLGGNRANFQHTCQKDWLQFFIKWNFNSIPYN